MSSTYRCVVCDRPLYTPGKGYGSHKCSERALRRRERREELEEERVENYTIREDDESEGRA